MKSFVTSWSGGKDSCFAYMAAIKAGMKPKVLMNMMNENGLVSRSHAIPESVLLQQAKELGLPIVTVPSTWKTYEENFIENLTSLTNQYSLEVGVFGDIDIESNRKWEEKVCAASGLYPFLPLWKQDRKGLVLKMINSGIECIIISCNPLLGEGFLGRTLNYQMITELEDIGIDVCGENGEFHTLVLNCPVFQNPINVGLLEKKVFKDYCFQEVILKTN